MKHYALFGHFEVSKENSRALTDILLQAAQLLHSNPECLQYLVGHNADKTKILICEVWTSTTAHDKALEPENIRELVLQA